MKRFFYSIVILLCGFFYISSIFAQNKANSQMTKEEKKAIEKSEQQALFSAAEQAIQNRSFVMEADKIEFKRGNFAYVSPTTNFVSLEGDYAMVQLSFNNGRSGANGIGGITVDGKASNVEIKTDKKGNVRLKMNVSGKAISAVVEIKLQKGSNKAYAFVYPNFNGENISFSGTLLPSRESSVFKARTF